MSTPVKNVLSSLQDAGGYITLAVNLAGTLVPLAIGLVKKIESIGQGTETVSYQVLIQTDTAELDAVDKLSSDDLAAINAELTKLGQPTVPAATPSPTDPNPNAT